MDTLLDAIEIRVLGSLMEKEMATPEYTPLSLNGVINACNQKTNRAPVLALDEQTVASALQSLKQQRLVFQSDASRVPKYWQDFTKQHDLELREAALLCLLLLRGPQTPGELRSRSESLCPAATLDEVLSGLDHLIASGLAARLPLQPGRKEQRYSHLLSGEPENIDLIPARKEPVMAAAAAESSRISQLEQRVAELQGELTELKETFLAFRKQFD